MNKVKKRMEDVTFEEFENWCNEKSCDGEWSYRIGLVCLGAICEVYAIHKLFGQKKAREEKWEEVKKEYFNLDVEIEVEDDRG